VDGCRPERPGAPESHRTRSRRRCGRRRSRCLPRRNRRAARRGRSLRRRRGAAPVPVRALPPSYGRTRTAPMRRRRIPPSRRRPSHHQSSSRRWNFRHRHRAAPRNRSIRPRPKVATAERTLSPAGRPGRTPPPSCPRPACDVSLRPLPGRTRVPPDGCRPTEEATDLPGRKDRNHPPFPSILRPNGGRVSSPACNRPNRETALWAAGSGLWPAPAGASRSPSARDDRLQILPS
jgi:hypothetical protein